MPTGSGTGTPTSSSSSSSTPTAQQIVDAIDLHLHGNIEAGGVQDYMIGGKRITKHTLPHLLEARKHYAALAAANSRGNSVTYAKFKKP